MSSEARDITEIVLTKSELVRDIERVRHRCQQLPMVKECVAEISSFKGRQIEHGRFAVDIAGNIRLKTRLQLGITIEAVGTGEIDSSGKTLHITDINIANDFNGILKRVLGIAGYTAGRTLNLRDKDSALIRNALTA